MNQTGLSNIRTSLSDYSKIAQIPWLKFPSTWDGYKDLSIRRGKYLVYSRYINSLSIVCAVLLIYLSTVDLSQDRLVLYLNIEVYLLPLAVAISLIQSFITVRKSQLFLEQLDDIEISQLASYYKAHLVTIFSVVIFNAAIYNVVRNLSLVDVGIVIGVIAVVALSWGGSYIIYYYSIIYPLKNWVVQRVKSSTETLELTEQQISGFVELLLRKRKEVNADSYLRLVFDKLGLPETQIDDDVTRVLDSTAKSSLSALFQMSHKAIAFIFSIMNILSMLNEAGLFTLLLNKLP